MSDEKIRLAGFIDDMLGDNQITGGEAVALLRDLHTASGDGTPGPARPDDPDARCVVRVQVLERVYRAVLALPFNLPQGLCDAIEAMYQSVRLDELQVQAQEPLMSQIMRAATESGAALQGSAPGPAPEAAQEFCRKVIEAGWDHGEVDSGDIQEWAVEAGILVPTQVTVACTPGCRCEGYDNIPGTCYRFAALLAELARAGTSDLRPKIETPRMWVCKKHGLNAMRMNDWIEGWECSGCRAELQGADAERREPTP